METSFNARCPAVKRLLREAQELHEATEEYYAHPIDDNLFEWHFTVRGPPETEFDGGVYHGRIIMPTEYPMKPPNIIFFTPNGRFETNKKICLSISGHHPETWQPSWSIRTALLAIIGFMPTPANGTIGSLDYTAEERALLSRKSVDCICPNCGRVGDLLKERTGKNEDLQKEAKEVSSQMTVSSKDNPIKETETEALPKEGCEVSSPKSDSAEDMPKGTQSASQVNPQPQLPSSHDESGSAVSSTTTTTTTTTTTPSNSSQPISNSNPNHSVNLVNSSSPRLDRSSPGTPQSSLTLIANNILLSAAVVLVIALVLRRLFLMESEITEEMEDILL